MPDTLAPKKTMTQRELDNKLTPIAEKVKEGPLVTGEIVKDYLFKPLPLLQDERISVKTKEQQQTQASAKEGLVKRPEVEDTGDIENVSTVQQGEVKPTLAARPVMYAADGMDDKEINNPIVVGEKGPEMLVPTGNGRFSILPNDVVNGLMEKTKSKKNKVKDMVYAEEGIDNISLVDKASSYLNKTFNSIPPNVRQFIYDTSSLGGTLGRRDAPFTEKNLNEKYLNELTAIAKKAKADGRDNINYKDYDTKLFENRSIVKNLQDPQWNLSTLLGYAGLETNNKGETIVTDQYDFNNITGKSDGSMHDASFMYNAARIAGGTFGSDKGEGSPVKINLGVID